MTMLRSTIGLATLFLLFSGAGLEAAQAKSGWEAEWEKTLQAAKKEGQLTIYISEVYEEIFREFGKKYPEIKVVAVPAQGGQLSQRIMSERRAGKYLVDLYLSGSDTIYNVFYKGGMLQPVKSTLLLPEVLDESKWLGKKHIYADEENQYILAFNGITQTYFNYNSKLVNPKEFKSYWDFVNPKWKGKILVFDPTSLSGPQGALRFLYNNPSIGPKFLRQFLGQMDLTATRDRRQLVDWLAQGKFSIMALQSPDRSDLYKAQEQGLPVGWFDSTQFQEGSPLSTSNGNLAVFDRPPHPNAARLALNWFLSREGQTVYQRIARDKDSLRTDIPKDTVLPHVRRVEGAHYMMLENPAWRDMTPVFKLVEEAWKKGR
jgi:iron(III) transport system substrate-binding protein